jgi:hypothetical protein
LPTRSACLRCFQSDIVVISEDRERLDSRKDWESGEIPGINCCPHGRGDVRSGQRRFDSFRDCEPIGNSLIGPKSDTAVLLAVSSKE